MRAGVWPGQVRAWTSSPNRTVAVAAEGSWPAARARIQAAEATGLVNCIMVPEMSQAMPSRSGGAGTRRLVVRVKGSAVGTAPAARCAWEASAFPMRSRPGGTLLVTVTVSRPPAVASRRVRARRRAAAASSSLGSRVRVAARGRDPAAEGVPGCLVGGGPGLVFFFALAQGAGREGRRRGEVGFDGGLDLGDGVADGVQEVGEVDLDGGGRGGVGVDAEDAAPAAGESCHGFHVAVVGVVDLAPGGAEPGEGIGADDLLDLGGDRGGLAGLEDAGVLAGEQEGGGQAGFAGGGGLDPGAGEVVEDDLGGRCPQPAAVAGAPAGLAGFDAGFFQLVGGRAPVEPARSGEAVMGVCDVRAFVGEGPQVTG